ncbi:MAG: extracellular solute-binding protein [Microthrixaceae bacterium]|nr:extracellular solute-binding protein [Microthrixaceae bacterium]
MNEDNGRDGLATASEFDSKPTLELFDFWRGMVDDGLATAYPGVEGQTNHLFAMATQSASMVVDSSAAVNTIAGLLEGTVDEALIEELGVELPDFAGLDIDIGVGEFPGIEEPGKGQIGGGAWYLTNSGTPEQQAAAWDFMKWFNATEQQVRWASEGSGLPVTQSALDDPGLQETWSGSLGGRWNTVAMEVLMNVDPDFPGPLIGDYKTSARRSEPHLRPCSWPTNRRRRPLPRRMRRSPLQPRSTSRPSKADPGRSVTTPFGCSSTQGAMSAHSTTESEAGFGLACRGAHRDL